MSTKALLSCWFFYTRSLADADTGIAAHWCPTQNHHTFWKRSFLIVLLLTLSVGRWSGLDAPLGFNPEHTTSISIQLSAFSEIRSSSGERNAAERLFALHRKRNQRIHEVLSSINCYWNNWGWTKICEWVSNDTFPVQCKYFVSPLYLSIPKHFKELCSSGVEFFKKK